MSRGSAREELASRQEIADTRWMDWTDVLAVGLALPGMEASTSYGTPALKVNGKLVTRLRTEDESLVLLGVPTEERAMLIEAAPHIFHTTPHYKDYPAVLARLSTFDEEALRPFLLRRWKAVAPKRLTAGSDAPARATSRVSAARAPSR